jgi:hypothetical protein
MTPQNGEPVREYTPEEMAAICAKFKQQFTVEDLLGYINDEGEKVPAEEVMAKAEALLRQIEARNRETAG